MLLTGYLVTLAAVASVVLFWWGGAIAITELALLASFPWSR
jgi:membrane protein implicated in regulation of membrane protease activity